MFSSFVTLELVGFVFVSIVGSLLHFTYKCSGNNFLVGAVSPVNESTWEHLKLIFFPMLVYGIFEYFSIGKYYDNFIAAKSIGILLGLITIVVVFYTYTSIIGSNFLLIDISTFIIGVAVAFASSYWAVYNAIYIPNAISFLVIILVICFVVFTFFPPHIALFLDPRSRKYGIK